MIIGICGLIGAGKDTAADYLVNFHEFRRDSFASALKDAVSAVFGWDRDMMEGRTKIAREWREKVDPWWANRLQIPHLTPRWIMQYWGTDVLRNCFHNDIWIASIENKIRNSQDDVVISDCRFQNEISAIKNAGGVVVRVVRGPDPEWFSDAIALNKGPGHIGWAIAKDNLLRLNVHPSEYSWVGTNFDYVLSNNGTVDSLYQQISNLVRDLHDAKSDLVL